ncbi:MAG: hypothetical protein QOH08_2479, partial [Chloroflexota bacterium]|nr:hypothetical protein [Chloroflexota bacterium]
SVASAHSGRHHQHAKPPAAAPAAPSILRVGITWE